MSEPRTPGGGGGAKVVKAGKAERRLETITIGDKTTTARGTRYLRRDDFEGQVAAGLLDVIEEISDKAGNLVKVKVESTRYIESDAALIDRVLKREVGGKRNVLVLNDEAHHAYRIRREEPDEGEDDDDDLEDFYREATVWIDGLDKVAKLRGINFCVDFSATPYFLGRVGPDANRPFPWVVSDFGLIDAIESGLVKIPQLAVRDTTGASIPGPADSLGRPVRPEGFAELAEKLGRPLHPPGRDVRCIVSVGMLTEGWDCNTVFHPPARKDTRQSRRRGGPTRIAPTRPRQSVSRASTASQGSTAPLSRLPSSCRSARRWGRTPPATPTYHHPARPGKFPGRGKADSRAPRRRSARALRHPCSPRRSPPPARAPDA
jgi:hypothetical protein